MLGECELQASQCLRWWLSQADPWGRIHPAFCPSQALMVQDRGCHEPLTTPIRLQILWRSQKEPEPLLPVPIGLAKLLSLLVISLPTSWWEALLLVFPSLLMSWGAVMLPFPLFRRV